MCEAGDELWVYDQTALGDSLLVESNPTDGEPDNFTQDAGPGTLSPHLFLIAFE